MNNNIYMYISTKTNAACFGACTCYKIHDQFLSRQLVSVAVEPIVVVYIYNCIPVYVYMQHSNANKVLFNGTPNEPFSDNTVLVLIGFWLGQ